MEGLEKLKKTPLFDCHLKAGGKIIDFGGWALPVQYTGILEEHHCVRQRAGLFDVSHMGEVRVEGRGALRYLQHLVANDVSRLSPGQICYAHMLYPNGGTVDDLLVYRLAEQEFFIVINAANTAKDVAWMQKVALDFRDVKVYDLSAATAELALQGPLAASILQRLTSADLSKIRYYWCQRGLKVAGLLCLVSRTGYTGEDGFEIFVEPENAPALWEALLQAGRPEGLRPVGLGARDSLRFEACMPLYGQELDADTSPLEAGLERYVAFDKPDFIGKAGLLERRQAGLKKRLVGFEMVDRGIARSHYRILKGATEVGYVTSGMYSPTLARNLGLGYVPPEMAGVGSEFHVEVRGQGLLARAVPTPFYRRSRR
ncbi:MAG: glycine cleavage system aminomethyltransferase GcvT [Acetobacteraceae bacterium]|nr:glycine cleavage system aminomethyltransferase GcvT [Acetobacteraceae bacterium]